MCDYSLHAVDHRRAKAGERLISTWFRGGTRGFRAVAESDECAVCLLPGSELVFDRPVTVTRIRWWGWRRETIVFGTEAIFRKVNLESEVSHHDQLEFPDGRTILLNRLDTGQVARVLKLGVDTSVEAQIGDLVSQTFSSTEINDGQPSAQMTI